MYVAIVEPTNTLFRYLRVARAKGFRTLVLTADADACRAAELAHYAETGDVRRRPRADGLAELVGAANPPVDTPDVTEDSRIDLAIECDVRDPAAIAAALRPHRDEIAGLLPGDEIYVETAFAAGSALGFDVASAEDARCQRIKSAMKQRMVDRGVSTAPFVTADSLAEAEAAWAGFGHDCMVKMVDFATSAHVYRATTHEELVAAWEAITSDPMKLPTPFPRPAQAVLEKFVGGQEVSAEGFVMGDRIEFVSNCEKVTSDRFVIVDHLVPAALSAVDHALVDDVVEQCVRALGLRNCVFHVEVHIVDGVPYVIESASRPPGQQMCELIDRAYGVDLHEVAVDLATRGTTEVRRPAPRSWFALLALYAEQTGTLTGVTGLRELNERGVLRQWHLRAHVGDQVRPLHTFQERYGWVQIEDPTQDGLRDVLRWAQEHLRLTVDPTPAPVPVAAPASAGRRPADAVADPAG